MNLVQRNIVAHPLRSILTTMAITLGVAMVLAASIVGNAANQTVSTLAAQENRVDLELIARENEPFAADLLAGLRQHPDVALVSPSLQLTAAATSPPIPELILQGVETAVYQTLYEPPLANGTFLQEPDSIVLPMQVALTHDLAVGDSVLVTANGRTQTLTVGGRLRVPTGVNNLNRQEIAFVPLPVAQSLAGTPDQIDQAAVSLRPGSRVNRAVAAIEQTLPAHLMGIPAHANGGPTLATLLVQGSLAGVGAIILLAAGFVIMNAFAMSITDRTREIGGLRALGMTRGQVQRQVLGEAILLGTSGVLIGIPAGVGLAWLVMLLRQTLDRQAFVVPWWGVAVAALLGLGTTILSAWQPARRASRISPLAAMRNRSAGSLAQTGWYEQHGPTAAWILMSLGSVALPVIALIWKPDFVVSAGMLILGLALMLAAVVLLLPAGMVWVTGGIRPFLERRFGTAGRIATDNLSRNKLRTLLTTAALMVGLTMIVTTSALFTLSFKGGLNGLFTLFHEDGMIVSDIPAMLASGELTAENSMDNDVLLAPQNPALVKTLSQVEGITIVRYGFAPVPPVIQTFPGSMGVFVDPEVFIPLGNFNFFAGSPEEAQALLQRGNAVLLVPIVAARLGVSVGDTILVPTQEGDVPFTVAGIGGVAWSYSIFSFADGERYFDVTEPSVVGIAVDDQGRLDDTLQEVEQHIADFDEVILFDMRDEGVGGMVQMVDQLQLLLNSLLLLAVVVAGIGVINTMVINISERSREIGLLRAVGTTRRQVRQIITIEAAIMGLVAAVAATLFGLLTLIAFVAIFTPGGTGSMGVNPGWDLVQLVLPPAMRDWAAASLFALLFGPLTAALAAYFPAKRAAALNIVETTRNERVSLQATTANRPETYRGPLFGRFSSSSPLTGLAWRNLQVNRLRTLLTALIISFGVALTVAAEYTSRALLDAFGDAGGGDLQITHGFMVEQFEMILSGIGYVLLAAAAFLIFNTFAMTIIQRRRQIGMLRCLGMTKRQVLRLVLLEALFVGGIGTGIGLITGPVLGQGIVTMMRLLAGDILAFGEGTFSVGTALLAAVLGLSVTLIAVMAPAWRAAGVTPLAALRGEGETVDTTTAASLRRFQWQHLLSAPALALLLIIALFAYLSFSPPGAWLQPPWNTAAAGLLVALWLAGVVMLLPLLLAGISQAARYLWGRRSANGRIAADNLQRAPGRSTLTAITLAIGITTIISLTGLMSFAFDDLFGFTFNRMVQREMWAVFPFDLEQGTAGLGGLDALELPQSQIDALVAEIGDRAELTPVRFTDVPELSFLGTSYFSFIVEPDALQDGFFTLQEGDWETAVSLLQNECGALTAPAVARRNGVQVGETFTLTGVDGPVTCTLAGVGAGMVNASILGPAAAEAVGATDVVSLLITPNPDADLPQLTADMQRIADQSEKSFLTSMRSYTQLFNEVTDLFSVAMSGILLLAVLAAALGVVNTMIMSVHERRRELGLLRAVGATRRQVTAVVTGEAALIGLAAGIAGFVAGCGVILIFVVTYGGNPWGVTNLDLWGTAGRALLSALGNGLVGLLAVPLISAAAARWPARSILRGTAVATLHPDHPKPAAAIARRWYHRGSLRVRFVAGTAVLLLLVLAGLVTAVTTHARNRVESEVQDVLHALITWNAGMIEFNLPADAAQLDLDALQSGDSFVFDADMLLRFAGLLEGVGEQGLETLRIVDREQIILLSLDLREVGTLWEVAPAAGSAAQVTSQRDGKVWLMEAVAPIQNESGDLLGSVYLTFNAHEIVQFLTRLQRRLWLAGTLLILLGCVAIWLVATPLLRAARGRLRLRLTLTMIFFAAGLVTLLQFITIPIERRQIESTLKAGLVAGVEWGGELVSSIALQDDNLDQNSLLSLFESPQEALPDLQSLGRLQELVESAQMEELAYTALQDESGEIVIADQLSLVGETAVLPTTTTLATETWRGEELWVVATPLTEGKDGPQIGAWRVGVRRDSVEAFLAESRTLFQMAGVIAVLAGALLAQGLGTAVAAPLHKASGPSDAASPVTLAPSSATDTRDEVTALTTAYNEMVAGLHEREWLQDMFGRFVSREVADAIRSGQVRLEGEKRVVSILFCDIFDFATLTTSSTPQEIVSLLNQYLPLVVDAAAAHEGTVNKFGGESTLVIYGAPKQVPDSAYHALRTAWQIQKGMAGLNQQRTSNGDEPLRVTIGINTGPVLAGAVGPPQRQEYTVIGDTVNLAARIEALGRQYPQHNILISGDTYDALGAQRQNFHFADLGLLPIRGKATPIRVWAVTGQNL